MLSCSDEGPATVPRHTPANVFLFFLPLLSSLLHGVHTEFIRKFTSVVAQCLQKLPTSNNRFTYNCDSHTINFLIDDGCAYCVVAAESISRQIPMAFLEGVKEDFTKRYDGGKATTAAANGPSWEFGPKLKERMQYCADHLEEISKLVEVKAQVQDFSQWGTKIRRKMWMQNAGMLSS